MNLEQAIAEYRRLNETKARAEELFKEKLAPLRDRIEQIENALLKFLDRSGQNSASTKAGMAYKSTLSNVKVTDLETFMQYVKANDAYDLYTPRITKTVYNHYVEQGIKIPGIEVDSFTKIRIRKP